MPELWRAVIKVSVITLRQHSLLSTSSEIDDNTSNYKTASVACGHNFCSHSHILIFQTKIRSKWIQYEVWERVFDLEKCFCISLNIFLH